MVTKKEIKEGVYIFETKNACNNNDTMSFFIEHYLPDNATVQFRDENYIEFVFDNHLYSAIAKGNGDFTHHKIKFDFIQ